MRVLLVEDQLQLAESVAQALKGMGLTVDVLHDGPKNASKRFRQ